uniref:EGF-like domain-containing protein n=1 Tax=Sciurus vulgaris TaxID=55149 RepID=A0A8D2ARI3_SCIVU
MTNNSIIILSLVVLHSSFTNGKTACKWQLVQEWHPQPSLYVVNWTLTDNICTNFYRDCWVWGVNTKMNIPHNQVVPQICPLQIQLGDILVISSDPSLQFSEINLMNVSEASFIDCVQNTTAEDQLLFGCKLKGINTVNPLWLSAGTHYFITVMASGPSLCQLGLQLNVTVKQQFCQESLSSEFCSGHGKCLSEVWKKTYSCHCQAPFHGKYCQELDTCYLRPCKNNGSCINKKEKWGKEGYKCICHPSFTGRNCTEIIGQCKPQICIHGNCSNITASSFICECDEQYTGPFCEELMKPPISHSCSEEEIWQNNCSVYICECSEGFFSQSCETDVNEYSSAACQNGAGFVNIPNDVVCISSLIYIGKLCKINETSQNSFSWKSNVACIKCEEDYQYSCMPGFTGKNCEKVIDQCRLLSINCLNEEWCFNVIGRFAYICISRCTKNPFGFVKKLYLIPQYSYYCGAIFCKRLFNISSFCLKGSEDEKCKVIIDVFVILAANCSESAVYVNKLENISYTCGFPCEGPTEIFAKRCSYLSDGDSQEYCCLCILRAAAKRCLQNTTDYQGNRCQHEVIYKDEVNTSRYLCIV